MTLLECGFGFSGAVAEAPGPPKPGASDFLPGSSRVFLASSRWDGGMLDMTGSAILVVGQRGLFGVWLVVDV